MWQEYIILENLGTGSFGQSNAFPLGSVSAKAYVFCAILLKHLGWGGRRGCWGYTMERKEESTRWIKGPIFRFNFSLRLSYRLATGSWQPFQERVHHEMCFVETVVSP